MRTLVRSVALHQSDLHIRLFSRLLEGSLSSNDQAFFLVWMWGGGGAVGVYSVGWKAALVGMVPPLWCPSLLPAALPRQTVRSLCRYGVPRRAWTIGGLPVGGRAKMRAEHNLRLIQVAGRLRYGHDVPLPAPISTPRCRPSSSLHHRPRHCTTWDTSSLMRECGLCPSLLLLCVTGSLYSHVWFFPMCFWDRVALAKYLKRKRRGVVQDYLRPSSSPRFPLSPTPTPAPAQGRGARATMQAAGTPQPSTTAPPSEAQVGGQCGLLRLQASCTCSGGVAYVLRGKLVCGWGL
jgi:hypothetical protein